MALFTRTSRATGITRTIEIPISEAEWADFMNGRGAGRLIQHAFPQLTAGQREFLISGVTDEEWNEMFGDDEEDEMEHGAFPEDGDSFEGGMEEVDGEEEATDVQERH